MPGAQVSQFCGHFGGAETQHLGSPTYQWPALVFTDAVILSGPVVEHPDLWRAGEVANLATSYANLVLGQAGSPFKLPKKRWGKADYMDVASIVAELLDTKGQPLSSQAATEALGRFARPLDNQQITRVEVKKLKVRGVHLAYGQVRARLYVGDKEHFDWFFVRRLYDRVLGISQAAFGDRVHAPTVEETVDAQAAGSGSG